MNSLDLVGDWLQSARGRAVYYLNPKPDDFDLVETATALARITRFVGQCKLDFEGSYSVAQHSVLVSELCSEYPKAALLHDAHEQYAGDLPTPFKVTMEQVCPGFKAGLRRVTDLLDEALAEKFGIDVRDLHAQAVKIADLRALATEKRDVMAPPPQPWIDLPEPDSRTIQPMTWYEARDAFIARYNQLS